MRHERRLLFRALTGKIGAQPTQTTDRNARRAGTTTPDRWRARLRGGGHVARRIGA
jgi:hypothetical protein